MGHHYSNYSNAPPVPPRYRRRRRYALKPLGDVLPIIEAGGVFAYAKQAGMLK